MTKTTSPRLDPAALAELLERTRQDVKRYRRLHPEWQAKAPASSPAPKGDNVESVDNATLCRKRHTE